MPLLQLLTDIHNDELKPMQQYLSSLIDSCRLSVANFNYMHQIRKDVAKLLIKEPALRHICSWECPVGDENIFAFDVNKRVKEYNKSLQLGAPSERGGFRGRPGFRFGRHNFGGRYSDRGRFSSYSPYSKEGRGRSSSSDKQ